MWTDQLIPRVMHGQLCSSASGAIKGVVSVLRDRSLAIVKNIKNVDSSKHVDHRTYCLQC